MPVQPDRAARPANAIQQANAIGQSIWLDSISREMIRSGELARLVGIGVSGVTSNPTIFEKAVSEGASYDEALLKFSQSGADAQRIFEGLAVEDIRDAADVLRPVYDRTDGKDGFVSIEVSPKLAKDAAGTVEEARRLFGSIGRPNVMIKVPGTPESAPAIRQLISEGVNVNVTLLFSITAYRKAAEAYIAGLRDYRPSGQDGRAKIASVASFFVSRVDSSADKLLEKPPRQVAGIDAESLKGTIGTANAKLAYAEFQQLFKGEPFRDLAQANAQVQRPLWASTSTKNPKFSDTMYVDGLMGPDTVNTLPPATLTAFLEHGKASDALTKGVDVARGQVQQLGELGISLDAITGDLLTGGVRAFADSYDKLLKQIEDKLAKLAPQSPPLTGRAGLGGLRGAVDAEIARLERDRVAGRIWAKDESVWPAPPSGSARAKDRLGWLSLPETMEATGIAAQSAAGTLLGQEFKQSVFLGMGGSVLAARTLQADIGARARLHVLDTIEPSSVARLEQEGFRPRGSLVIVSSKSGTTPETLALEAVYRMKRAEAWRQSSGRLAGAEDSARGFIAITDEGTPLAARGAEFQRVFRAPADVGGRFSALSEFGLVPAALMGLDVARLNDSARSMAGACQAPGQQNPGLRLAAAIVTQARAGRDKLTLITSPSLRSLAQWVEQMIAESLGKSGRGVIPVIGEPLYGAGSYGPDRQFVYIRLAGERLEDGQATDALAHSLEAAGQPVLRTDLADRYAVAGEFFRWEFATAVAAHCMGVYPFDEPDVASAKAKAQQVLGRGWAPAVPERTLYAAVEYLLRQRRPGDYFSIMAYAPESESFDRAVASLREGITGRTGMATTFAYGPRYLHSTGQLHKGGPDNVLALVIVADAGEPSDVALRPLARLFKAQSAGDVEALRERGRRVAFVRLGDAGRQVSAESAISELAASWRV
jgi:transaldolase/glucose-6-phosphate isomerase